MLKDWFSDPWKSWGVYHHISLYTEKSYIPSRIAGSLAINVGYVIGIKNKEKNTCVSCSRKYRYIVCMFMYSWCFNIYGTPHTCLNPTFPPKQPSVETQGGKLQEGGRSLANQQTTAWKSSYSLELLTVRRFTFGECYFAYFQWGFFIFLFIASSFCKRYLFVFILFLLKIYIAVIYLRWQNHMMIIYERTKIYFLWDRRLIRILANQCS